MKRNTLITLALGALVFSSAAPAAGDFPTRAVRLVVPASPGGGSDMIARPLALSWGKAFHQSIVVDNRGGGGGIIGSKAVQDAPADGYTMGLVTDGHVVAALMQKQRPYDPLKDFTPIGIIGTTPNILMVARHTGIENFAQFMEKAKAKPEALSYGSSGMGGNLHLATARFEHAAGVRLLHVPFKSGGEAMQELLAGRIDLILGAPSNALAFRDDPRIRLIAVSSAEAIEAFPGLPTIKSLGVDYQYVTTVSIIGPAGIPAPVVQRLNHSLNEVLRTSPDMQKTLEAQLFTPRPGEPEALRAKLAQDIAEVEADIKAGRLNLAQ